MPLVCHEFIRTNMFLIVVGIAVFRVDERSPKRDLEYFDYCDTYGLYEPKSVYDNYRRAFTSVPLKPGRYRWKFIKIEPVISETGNL